MSRKVAAFVLVFFLLTFQAVRADFEVWGETSGLFTVGTPQKFNIYVRNLDDPSDTDYDITLVTKQATCVGGGNCNHLLHVYLQSDRVLELDQNQAGFTVATVTSLGPFVDGVIEFDVQGPSGTRRVSATGFIAAMPVSLPEFGLLGILELAALALIILIVSDRLFLGL
jgi:hypothetical protein